MGSPNYPKILLIQVLLYFNNSLKQELTLNNFLQPAKSLCICSDIVEGEKQDRCFVKS